MDAIQTHIVKQIAAVSSEYQRQRTGRAPQSVSVVLSEDTLVITLHGELSPAERVISQTAAGAAKVQEFHRLLFAASSDNFRREIERITGMPVHEAAGEVEPAVGAVHAFTTGTMVQVFHFAAPVFHAFAADPAEPL